jgi:hypothetical protein
MSHAPSHLTSHLNHAQQETRTPDASIYRLLAHAGVTINAAPADFILGYQEGQKQYWQHHRHETTIEASTLLALVRNGWGGSRASAMWQTGYITGRMSLLFGQESLRPVRNNLS